MQLRIVLSLMLTVTALPMALPGQASELYPRGPDFQADRETQLMVAVNQDQLQGKWKQFKGELKQKWGEFTDDDLLSIEGRVDKLEGKIQERYGDRREDIKKWVDDWFDHHAETKELS